MHKKPLNNNNNNKKKPKARLHWYPLQVFKNVGLPLVNFYERIVS